MNKTSAYFIILSNICDIQKKNRKKFVLAYRKAYIPILRFLTENGFINGFSIFGDHICIFVRYCANGAPLINKVTRFALSKRRLTFKLNSSDSAHRPYRTVVISTTKGLLLEPHARLLHLGGIFVFGLN